MEALMSGVALVKCESYEYIAVREAVEKGIGLLGGAGMFVKSGEKIVLKPNWLAADAPELCTTTHPSVFKAVAEVFKAAGAVLTYGDSPAFQSPELAAKKTLCKAAADELGILPADFVNGVEVFFEKGVQNKKFTVVKAITENDGLISLPKLKTHGFMKFTGSIKNQFGCIPGTLKGEFHVRVPDSNDFAKMLVDLNSFIHPRLYVMDGILAMEGNGPRGGSPKKMNVLIFSADPVALDATVCRMLGLDPALVPTVKFGMEAGAGTYKAEDIKMLGDDISMFTDKNFDIKREPLKPFKASGFLKFISNALVPKPFIAAEKCTRCGTCVKMCPVNPKAVDWHDGDKKKPPSYKYERCIRCYCCQELCPEKAISLKVPFIRKIFVKKKKK
jgi:uncharacterized protein (DUF362 family)/Pyruvate/2-oxoacid:ferredoxin oxidoreductase delta subunit